MPVRHPSSSTCRQLWRCCLMGLTALMTACSEGYPPTDHVPQEPHRMTAAQRIEALNDLSERSAWSRSWRYSMPEACVLRVQKRPVGERADRRWHLSAARFELAGGESSEAFKVIAGDAHASSSEPMVVLQTSHWFDARFALSLLNHLKQDCMP